MSQYDTKPTLAPKLAIVSSHKTTAPITFSQRSKPVNLPRLSRSESRSSLRSERLTGTDIKLDIPTLALEASNSEVNLNADSNSPPLSMTQDMQSFDSDALIIPSTLHIPQTLWDPLLDSQTVLSTVLPAPDLRVEEIATDNNDALERSYSNLSSYEAEESSTRFAVDSYQLNPSETVESSISSSSRLPVPTISQPNTDILCSKPSENELDTLDDYDGSRLSVLPKHLRTPSKQKLSLSLLQATLSISVENLFANEGEQLESTKSELQRELHPLLASKSTQYLSRHTQSMPLRHRRSSAVERRETAEIKPELEFGIESSEKLIKSEHSEEIMREEVEITPDIITEKLSDDEQNLNEEVIAYSDEEFVSELPLLIQGMGIEVPAIKVHKPTRKVTLTPQTEDTSIHQFCLSSKSDKSPPNYLIDKELPDQLIGMRYHRRPKFLYPLWVPSSPKYSVNRVALRDKLYPLYDPKSYSHHSQYYQEYFQDNYIFTTPQTGISAAFDASLDRAIQHKFSSLNDIPSAQTNVVKKIKRVSSQPNLAESRFEEENISFPSDVSSKFFEEIEAQKSYIQTIKMSQTKKNSQSTDTSTRRHSSFDDELAMLPLRRYSYDVQPRSRRPSFARSKERHSFSSFHFSDYLSRRVGRHSIMEGSASDALEDLNEIVNSVPLVGFDEVPKYVTSLDSIDAKLSDSNCDETQTALLSCQKGIILRYIGRLVEAHDSLSAAIELEPGYGEPLWYRAIICYVNGMDKAALRDLLTLLELNPRHVQAYKLRGELYNQIGLSRNAMQDFTEALTLDPNDTQALLMRSELYEKNGEMPLAIEDLKRTAILDKTNINALFKTVHYQFSKARYKSALENASAILLVEPRNIEALCLRGKCYTMLNAYHESLKDYSAAIHYDPTSSAAFYHRGCVLRKVKPWQAVRDFSTAIVLDVNNRNTESFLHRAIVYRSLKLYDEAFFDLTTYIKLNPSKAIGHTLIALMYHKHRKDFYRAVHHLTIAIGLDPVNAKTYACRGDAYFILSNLKAALLDYSRASHLSPDDTNYHILRGKVLLHMDKLTLAKNHLYYSRKLLPGESYQKSIVGHSSILQHVVVENFLGFHKDALTLLEGSRDVPSYDSFVLLGKTQMKLKNYEGALENLKIARRILSSSGQEIENRKIANILFLQGLCEYSLGRNNRAIEVFTESLSLYPQSHEAYYYRGLASIKSPHNKKGILDLNKSLALNTKFFQAYLARAAYYFMEGRISKAILNCNEAIELEKDSVRAYFYRGTLKYFMKSFPSAIQDLTRTISLDSCCYLAYYNRAASNSSIGSYYDAIKDYTIAQILLNSYSQHLSTDSMIEAKIIQNRGLIYFRLCDYFNALSDFKFVSTQLANMNKLTKNIAIPLYQAISISLHRLGQVNQAVSYMNLVLELDRTSIHGFIGRGNIYMDYMNQPGYQLSKNDFCRAIHLNPTNATARINLAFLLQFEGKFAHAWRHLTNALESDPANPYALEARSIICLQMQDMFAATLDIDRALKSKKTPQFLNSAGIIYFYSKFPKIAMQLFLEATKLDPTYQLAYHNAGTLLLINKLYIESDETFSKAVLPELKTDEHILINRSVVRLLLGRKQESLEDLRVAEEINANFSHIHVNKACHYMLSGETQLASECYQQAVSTGSNNKPILEQTMEVLRESQHYNSHYN